MKQVFKIDSEGFYLEPYIPQPNEVMDFDYVGVMPTEGLYKHKWNGTEWVEGLSQAEIDTIKNAPQPVSELDQLKKQQADLVFELMMKGVL